MLKPPGNRSEILSKNGSPPQAFESHIDDSTISCVITRFQLRSALWMPLCSFYIDGFGKKHAEEDFWTNTLFLFG